MICHYLKTVVFGFLVLASSFLSAQVISPFTSIYQTHQRGGIVFLSNSALGCSSNPPVATGTCQLGALEVAPVGTTRNDNYSSVYIDIDGDGTTFMSSSDQLNLPSCSQITKAFLFWAASGSSTSGLNQVKLKVNNGSYQAVTASFSLSNTSGFNSYHCYADVTSLLSGAGGNASITVADVSSSQVGTSNTFGSWNLVVVYKNDVMNMRHLNVISGLAYLSLTNPSVTIPLSGFLTPTTGAVSFEIGAYSHDGDRGMTGDAILFNGNLTYLPVIDLVNPSGDVMNSTVSNNGIADVFRNPLLGNTMGTDADIYVPANLLNVFLANSATTASVQLTTTTDNYLTQAITSAIDSYEPDLRATIKAKDVNTSTLDPGDIIQYRLTGYNVGSDLSFNTVLVDTLDANVNYIPNSTSVVFGPNSGSKTDVGGDDQVDYNSLTRVLKIRIGTGATATSGGTLSGSPTGVDSTVVTYSVAVSQSCLKLSCNNTIKARAYISGMGAALSHTFSNASTPGTTSAGCAVMGSTSNTVSLTGCVTPTATNSSPACTGGSITLNATNDAEATYNWSGPNSYTASGRNQTISPVTISISGVYTVTLSIPATTCQATATTSVTITVCTPTAVNDFTSTSINTAVSGNASANDLNITPNSTFAIIAQPGNGTVSMDPATGAYSFMPGPGFAGVTTATYQVCTGLPVICSQASITFTVFPNLVANPDIINTTPLLSTTGNFLSNDTGIIPGSCYSVSVSPPPVGSGTLIVNASTGQYTFIPNILFTGTVQSSYTVCNICLNPIQCSSATFSLYVTNSPIAVDDATTTLINTSVNGDASSNDSGLLGGIYTFGNVSPGTGTLTGNPLTGLFVFTPAANFTGTTFVTYTLCNLSPPCATANITFTVYSQVIANPDIVSTTPSVATSGSLLANDGGIVANAVYSVSISQPASSTGTLILNPLTGEYTFAPNPSFTGTALTSYTVCNTSVNPEQCSSATITFSVFAPVPLAVDDYTLTIINTSVSGNVGLNDINIPGGTFAFGSPTSGTLTTNSSTGEYTFTPLPGFTGSISVTYTLCTAILPCSTASLIIAVYPQLVANPDLTATTISTSVTGNFMMNDTGMVPGGNYSIALAPVASSLGVIQLNVFNGQFTFVPVSSVSGSAVTSYTLIQYNGAMQVQNSITTVSVIVTDKSSPIGIAKSIRTVSYNSDATIDLVYKLVVKNYSNQTLNSVSVEDNLSATFPSPATFTVTSPPLLLNPTGSQLSLNASYSGTGSNTVITLPGTSSLSPGRTDTIQFMVKIDPHGTGLPYNNFAAVSAVVSGSTMSDNSVDGLDPDPDHNADPGDNTSPTTFTFTLVKIGIAKSAAKSESLGNGCFTTVFKFTVKNYGPNTIYNVKVTDHLPNTFGSSGYTVLSTPVSVNGYLQPDPSYNGSSSNNLLLFNSQLGVGQTDTLLLEVRFCTTTGSFTNTATAFGNSMPGGGFIGYDISTYGLDPDPNGNNNPSDEGEDQGTVFYPAEDLFIPQGFSPNGDGINDKFEIRGLRDYPDLELSIINRWGNLVYHKQHYDNTWGGTGEEGKQFMSDNLPEGTYFYIVNLGDGQKPLKGYVYINRSVR